MLLQPTADGSGDFQISVKKPYVENTGIGFYGFLDVEI